MANENIKNVGKGAKTEAEAETLKIREEIKKLKEKHERILVAINSDKSVVDSLKKEVSEKNKTLISLTKKIEKENKDLFEIEKAKGEKLDSLMEGKQNRWFSATKKSFEKDLLELEKEIKIYKKELDSLSNQKDFFREELKNLITIREKEENNKKSELIKFNSELVELGRKVSEEKDKLKDVQEEKRKANELVTLATCGLHEVQQYSDVARTRLIDLENNQKQAKEILNNTNIKIKGLEDVIGEKKQDLLVIEKDILATKKEQKKEQDLLGEAIQHRISLNNFENILKQKEAYIRAQYKRAGIKYD